MKKITLLIAFLISFISGSYAQSASSYAFSSSSGTYTDNSGAATLLPLVKADSYISPAQNIGFTFVYEGTPYTQFKMSSNGFISLNMTGTSSLTTNDLSSANAATRPIIAPLWDDLDGRTTGDVSVASYELTGTAPNQVLTVEWSNWEWNYGSTTPVISFQVKLYETTNVIEFVYRQESTAVASGSASIGIGSATGSGAGSYLNVTNVGTPAVSSSTSTTNINTKPATGQIFSFTPPAPCTGTPTAGTVTPAIQNICTGSTPASLVAAGYSTGASGFTFQWEESNDDGATDTWAPVVGGTGATSVSYTPAAFSGTTIYYRMNMTCSGSGLSAQTASVMVTTPVNPSTQVSNVLIPATTVGYSQATVNWTNGNGGRRVVYISNTSTFTDPVNGNAPALTPNAVYAGSGQQLIFDGTTATVTVTGLSAGTQYYIKAYEYVRCGSGPYDYFYNVSNGTNTGNFTTCSSYTVPATENFTTYVPGCWQEADNGDLAAGPSTFGSSTWIDDGFGNVGTTGSARYNVYTTGANDWIMSPLYVIPVSGYELKFDAAATQYAATTAPTTAWEADDFVEVLVSTGTNNWTVLYTYNDTNVPSNTGTTNIIDLDAYAGQTVRFAFRVVEGASNGAADIDFSIDNFEIRLTPACSNPIGLNVSNLTSSSATITWTATTGNYQYVLDTVATDPAGSGTTLTGETYNATPLTPVTTYYFHVRTVCAGPIYSIWSTISFTTPPMPPTNDNCANAIVLTPGGVFGDQDITGTVFGANTTAGIAPSCQASFTADVWYSVVIPASGNITIATQTAASNSMTDSVVAAFSGACGGLTQIGCDDDSGPTGPNDLMSVLSLSGRTPGEVVYIGVWKYATATPTTTNSQFIISTYDASLSTGSFDAASFKAYPNPVKDVLNLSYSTEISSVEIFNMLGQNVLTKALNVAQGQIDMSGLNAGNYIVKVTADGLTQTIKVVKQ